MSLCDCSNLLPRPHIPPTSALPSINYSPCFCVTAAEVGLIAETMQKISPALRLITAEDGSAHFIHWSNLKGYVRFYIGMAGIGKNKSQMGAPSMEVLEENLDASQLAMGKAIEALLEGFLLLLSEISYQLFEFLLTTVGNSRILKFIGRSTKELVYYTIAFLHMTEEQVWQFYFVRLKML